MPQPYDYFGLMGGAANIGGVVPAIQDTLLGQQKMQANQLAIQKAQDEQAQAQAFRTDFAAALQNPNPQTIPSLLAKYPQFADQLKAGWETYRGPAKEAKFRLALDVHNYISHGDWDKAADLLSQHQDADVAAGMAQSGEYEPLIAEIRQKSPTALGLAAVMMASIYPDKYSENWKALNPVEKTPQNAREYDWRVQQFGKAAADEWLSTQDTKLVPVQQGGSVYAYGPTGQSQGSGAPTEGPGQPPNGAGIPSGSPLSPGAAPAPNALTFGQFKAYADVQGWDKAASWANQNGLVVEVESPAQAGSLKPGTRYITPDGRTFVR